MRCAPDDRSLAARARSGDASAFAILLARHRPQLERACARVLGDSAQCGDVAHEAALVAWLQILLRRAEHG